LSDLNIGGLSSSSIELKSGESFKPDVASMKKNWFANFLQTTTTTSKPETINYKNWFANFKITTTKSPISNEGRLLLTKNLEESSHKDTELDTLLSFRVDNQTQINKRLLQKLI
jgi:hypothetical protein